jgi:hypothetical protein
MDYFYNSSLKNLTIAMMSLFNDINVKRYGDDGIETKTIRVPIKFGPQSKYYQSRTEDASGQRYYIQLPALSIVPNGFAFNSGRSTSSKEPRALLNPEQYENPDEFLVDMMPSPWDVNFSVGIRTESFQDFSQIIEQIIPFFAPSVYLRVKEFNTVNLERDIKVTLNGLSPEFTDSLEQDERREVNGTLDFTAEAFFYGPITSAAIIEKITTQYGLNPNHNVIDTYMTSALPISAAQLITTSGTVTSGIIEKPPVDEYGYVNRMED